MTAHARNGDPITSHEAAATVDTSRSQTAVLRLLRQYMGRYFTQRGVVATYQTVQRQLQEVGDLLPGDWRPPPLSESRIRTAVRELQRLGYVTHAGYTTPPPGQRREAIWQLAEDA